MNDEQAKTALQRKTNEKRAKKTLNVQIDW